MSWRIVRGKKDPISGAAFEPPGGALAPRFDDLGFEHTYECEVRPSTAEEKEGAVFIPGDVPPEKRASCECLVIRVRTEAGTAWKAAIYGSHQFDGYVEGVFGTPRRDSLLVVTGGFSFLVSVDRPGEHEWIASETSGLVAVPALGVLAVADHDQLHGIGPTGPSWATQRLSLCCLRLKTVEEGVLLGDAQDTNSRDVPFRVDLRDGSHHGGWEHTP